MTRALTAAIVLCVCAAFGNSTGNAAASAADMKPVASVTLPCESAYQVISPNGKTLAAVCNADHSMRVVDIASGKELFAQPGDVRPSTAGFSSDGRWFGVGLWDGTVKIVPLAGGAAQEWKVSEHRVHMVEFLPDGHSVFVDALGDPAQIWDLSGTPKLVATLHSDFSGPSAMAISADGKLLATAGGDTAIRIYDTATWKMLHENRSASKLEMFGMDFTPDGKYLLAGGADDHVIVIDPATGEETHKLGGEPGVVDEISVLGDGKHAMVEYVDEDDINKPPVDALWNLQTQKAQTVPGLAKFTGQQMVNGKLWFTSANGTTLQIFQYE
jgi:WD40 repeat protein